MISAPAKIGAHVSEVDTPALLIELDALERNIRRMQQRVAGTGIRVRPHAKTHKSTAIANLQLQAGAVGVCCQKVSEAEILVDGGIGDVLVSNEVVGTAKLERVAALARRAKRLGVCVDEMDNVAQLAAAAEKFGANVDVLVELNVGGNRCGVETPRDAVRLAAAIVKTQSLRFAGLQAYHGSAQHVRAHEDRRRAIAGAAEKVSATVDLLRRDGFECPRITGAGTGSFEFEIASGVYDELQVGSYVFMDADYGRNLDRCGAPVSEFENALFLLTTVMSTPAADRAVVDAGLKALSVDSGMPLLAGGDGVSYAGASDEHGSLALGGNRRFRLGEKIRLIPGHCDPTVNLHDWYVGIRNEHVECVWPVSARGAVF
jgi:3-hydroxy-D-aspartate aldolase